MNERIGKLAVEAGAHWDHGDWNMPSAVYFSEGDLEKFAELIVAECLRQVEEQYKPVLEDEVMMKDTHWDGYVQCGVDSYVAIREHFFGVDQ
jgi:hypothetical protein